MVEQPRSPSNVLHNAAMARSLKGAVLPPLEPHPVHFDHWLHIVWAELVTWVAFV